MSEQERIVAELRDIARLACDGARAARNRKAMLVQDARQTLDADMRRLEALWDEIVVARMELDFCGSGS